MEKSYQKNRKWNVRFFKEGKFRFSYRTGTITLSLLTVSFAFICSAFIIATSLIELIFAKLMFPVLSVSDIETGQRTKNPFGYWEQFISDYVDRV